MGIPESIRYTDGTSAQRVYTTGFACEPPDADAATMANAPIRAVPGIAGISVESERQ